MEDATALERLRALVWAHDRLLAALWVHVLSETTSEPIEEAEAARSLSISELEDLSPEITTADGARHLLATIEIMEEVWERITATLRMLAEPIPVVPTAYGHRLAEEFAAGQHGTAKEPPDEPASGDDEPPRGVQPGRDDATRRARRRWRWPRS